MHNIIDEKFWLAIAFFAFVVLILKYVWPILSQKISAQSSQIAKELLDAKQMKEEAEKLLKETKLNYEKSIESSKKLIQEAEDEAKKMIEDMKKELKKDSEKKILALNVKIQSEEEKAIRELKEKIVNLAFEKIDVLKSNQSDVVKKSLSDIAKTIN